MFPAMAVAGIASSALSSISNAASVSQTNALNEKLQREQWARDDSAYQRSVADMQKAGLNPLSGVNPQSSPLSAQMQPYQDNNLVGSAIQSMARDVLNLSFQQHQMNVADKNLALAAISKGVNPSEIGLNPKYDNDDLIETYKKFLSAQAADMSKNADSAGTRYDGLVGKTVNDIRNALPVVDDVLGASNKAAARSYSAIKSAVGEYAPKVVNGVPKVLKGFKPAFDSAVHNVKQGWNLFKKKVFKK